MLKARTFALIFLAVATVAGLGQTAFAKVRKEATFKVRIENVSAAEGQPGEGGQRYPFALSPGIFVVNHKSQYFFEVGKSADPALESQAEDGNPEGLYKRLLTKVGSIYLGVFNTPVGASTPGPILPGGAYEFTFKATEGMKLSVAAMFGQSNDLFYAPKRAIALFDESGNPLSGDVTESFLLWDAGTEVNQAPGVGGDQAPRQKSPNTGAAETGVVRPVNDGFAYPDTKDVLRVTISAQ
jgi:hypothetical protein